MRSDKIAAAALLVLAFSLAGCRSGALETAVIQLGGSPLTVEIASTPEERQKGLMDRRSLDPGRGMLFVFEDERQVSFWMKDTSIPLSIAFISADGTIRQIEDMEPFSLAPVDSRRHVLYALEVNKGLFAQRGVKAGDRLELPARPAP